MQATQEALETTLAEAPPTPPTKDPFQSPLDYPNIDDFVNEIMKEPQGAFKTRNPIQKIDIPNIEGTTDEERRPKHGF